ncbi:MAG TPA: O-antigen ligase family protein [Polyangiales bacterium]|jgi:hypothetical protein|nr:O-antigen ligase family protein [Polyangiales bacterium]
MSVNVFTFIVLAAGLLTNEAVCIVFAVVFTLFGATAAVALPALGGAAITPALLFLPFIALHAIFARIRSHEPFTLSRPGTLLAIVVLWGLISAVVMPRVFGGETQVIVLDRLVARGPRLYPLRPLPTNITQSVYALGHFVCFLALRTLLRAPGRLLTFRNAVLLVAALDVVMAVLNLAENLLHLPSLLDYLRNAEGYGLAIEYAMGGLPRIHGTFPEASLFAYYSLPLFAFSLSLWTARAELRYSPYVCCALLLMLLLSTSATAYVGLAGYSVCYAFAELPRKRIPQLLAFAAACLALLVLGMYALELDATRHLDRFVHATLIDKAESGSGQERAAWNAQAFRNFLDTYWLGVGLGSCRASSFLLVLISNLGVFGATMFALFALNVCRAPYVERAQISDQEFAVRKAASDAVVAGLIAAAAGVGMFDLGVSFYMFAAAASSLGSVQERPSLALEPSHA